MAAFVSLTATASAVAQSQPVPLPSGGPDGPSLSQIYVGPKQKARKANDCNAAARQQQLCIAYWTVGPLNPDAPANQPALLMINGSASTSAEWDPHLLARLAANRTLILPDNRCVGNSGCRLDSQSDPVLEIKYMANDMNAFLLALPANLVDGPIDVLGWSMGGEVAQSLATNYPQDVRRLLLPGTLPGSGLVANAPCKRPYKPNPNTNAIFGCGPTTLGPDWANTIDDSATCSGNKNRGYCQDLQLRTLFQPCYPSQSNPDENICTWNSGSSPAPPTVSGNHSCTKAISTYAQWPGKQAACAQLQRSRVASGDNPNGTNNPSANALLPDDFELDPQGYGTADAQDNAENNWLYGTPAPTPPPTNPNWSMLPGLKMPVLIAGGNGDVLTPGANSPAMYKQILSGKPPVQPSIVMYNTAGHALLFQCNDDFGSRADAFLLATTPVPFNTTTNCVSDLAPNPNFSTPQFTPASASFGNQTLYTKSAPQTFTLSNQGPTPFAVGGVSVAQAAGGQPGYEEFTVQPSATGGCASGMTLKPTASCSYSVVYAPTVVGPAAGTLTVDTDAGPQTAQLSGTGVAPKVALGAESQSFGPVAPGGSVSYVFNVANNSGSALTVTSSSITGDGAAQFSVVPAAPIGCGNASVAAGSSCAVTVTYKPSAAGTSTAQLVVQTSAGQATVQLNGTASGSLGAPPTAQQTVVTTAGSRSVDSSGTATVGMACVAAKDGNCSGSAQLLAPGSSSVTASATTASVSRKRGLARQDHRPGARLVGEGKISVAKAKSGKVKIKLNHLGRKFMKSHRRVSMILSQVADDGSPLIERRVTLRFHGRRH